MEVVLSFRQVIDKKQSSQLNECHFPASIQLSILVENNEQIQIDDLIERSDKTQLPNTEHGFPFRSFP